MFDVRAHFGKWILVGAMAAAPVGAEVIFEDNFDDQPDWHSAMHSTEREQFADKHNLPDGWSAVRQDPNWSESMGFMGGRESIEILGSNSDKARGTRGKSYVAWRDATEEPMWRWNSDSILAKYFPDGHEQLYVTFWIRFSPDWTPLGNTGLTKLFRISHWDGGGSIFGYGNDRNNGPVMIWDYEANSYGARINITKRGYPIFSNYGLTNPPTPNWPRSSGPLNFDNNIRDLDGDGAEDNEITKLFNRLTGEPVKGGVVTHDEIWGSDWHKIEFFVKMNSGPGNLDGELWMWINEQLVVRNVTVPWGGYETSVMPKWNVVALGGNSHFHAYPDTKRRQEWYSIDDVVVRSSLPPEKLDGKNKAPSPPDNIFVN